jgi:hypothetical protein
MILENNDDDFRVDMKLTIMNSPRFENITSLRYMGIFEIYLVL